MRHLFVINPAAKKIKNHVNEITSGINDFFKEYPGIDYEIYTSGWCRDAVPYIRHYILDKNASKKETTRVHAIGGSGTLFEVVNGIMGIENAEIAAYPYGSANVFLRYFRKENIKLFSDMKNQVFDRSIPIDVIRCGNNYGICYGIIGFEASCAVKGDKWIERGLSPDLSYLFLGFPDLYFKKEICRDYEIEVDGKRFDGRYFSILIANTPCYGQRFSPASNAHPDDGKLEIFLIKEFSRLKYTITSYDYFSGNYQKLDTLIHCSGQKMTVRAKETMCMNIDSETFYGNVAEFSLLPGAIRVACPQQIDLGGLPLIYNKPGEGKRNDR